MDALLLAMIVLALSGAVAFMLSRWQRAATALAGGGALAGCVLGLVPAWRVLLGAAPEASQLVWDATHGVFSVELDALGAFFLVPVLSLSALAAIYGSHYLSAYGPDKRLGSAWFFFNVFVAAMAMVVCARTVFLFVAAWEVMSIAAYCLVTFEHAKADVCRAGWIYLIAAHLGVIFVILAFLALGRQAGSLEFQAFETMDALDAGGSSLVFVLGLVGFGAKAGLVPFHVWLPEAHPAAPAHVSALMSAVMIKMGLYGLLRVLSFLGPPAAWWGVTLGGIGLLTALVGIAMALQQRDVKRVLAYSSIENMGLIVLALGVGIWGWASRLPVVAALGAAAALLHVWNHALMKGLMFFAAGSVVHATGAKDMEQLGGLMKRMPWTGVALVIGALAIAALPPLNGFVSKWLVYLSLLKGALAVGDGMSLTALLAVGLLALIGGLAALTFVRLLGIVVLGSPRTDAARQGRESSPWLIAPMYVIILICVMTAVIPQPVAGVTLGPIARILGPEACQTWLDLQVADAPVAVVGAWNAWILAATLGIAGAWLALAPQTMWLRGPTWGCGYANPTNRMQYTGRSFVEMIAEHLFPRFLRPRSTKKIGGGLFPTEARFQSDCPDPVSQKVYEPFFHRWADRFAALRILQQGKINIYLVYIMLTVVLTLAWASLRTWWWRSS